MGVIGAEQALRLQVYAAHSTSLEAATVGGRWGGQAVPVVRQGRKLWSKTLAVLAWGIRGWSGAEGAEEPVLPTRGHGPVAQKAGQAGSWTNQTVALHLPTPGAQALRLGAFWLLSFQKPSKVDGTPILQIRGTKWLIADKRQSQNVKPSVSRCLLHFGRLDWKGTLSCGGWL